jgi:hypothetical protein
MLVLKPTLSTAAATILVMATQAASLSAQPPNRQRGNPFREGRVGDDELSLGIKKDRQSAGHPEPKVRFPKPVVKSTAKVRPIELNIASGTTIADAWNQHFKNRRTGLSAEERTEHASRIRETVRNLIARARKSIKQENLASAQRHFDEVIALIQAALLHGVPQAWMYEALVLSLRASGAPSAEIERAMMSAVDFSGTSESTMYIAAQMARIGLDERALAIFQEVARSQPFRPEPYLQGLRAAQRLNDIDGEMWACAGILQHAWPKNQQYIAEEALRIAKARHDLLIRHKQTEKASQFYEAIQMASARDCAVRVTWTGDADIDLIIQEPAGTVCSIQNPRTTGGGVLLGDTFSGADAKTVDGFSESYVCPHAFTGDYRLLVRRIWGKVTAGKVTVEISTHLGTKRQQYLKKQISITDKDALVLFNVNDGRRQQPIAEKQLAHLEQAQRLVNQAIVRQQLSSSHNSAAVADFLKARRLGLAAQGRDPLARGRRVGFMPQITTLPEGTNLMANAIVSADRRYIRFTSPPTPVFTGIGEVHTFNFVSGQGGQVGGGGGGGGIGGGAGGGMGGGFGGGF